MLISVPDDHQVGMTVPKGGSMCANCKYLTGEGKRCANGYFIEWNDGDRLPRPADVYCCDFEASNQ